MEEVKTIDPAFKIAQETNEDLKVVEKDLSKFIDELSVSLMIVVPPSAPVAPVATATYCLGLTWPVAVQV